MAAVREIFLNFIMVNNMTSHKVIIAMKPPLIECAPKKITDHKILIISCMIKITKADLTSLFFKPSFQMMKSEIPIIRCKIIHTGANSQSGGANDGLFIAAYQVGIESIKKIVPITPASRQITRHMINFTEFDKILFDEYSVLSIEY